MTRNAKNTTATVIPTMRYRDAPAAIEWLCRAFGFEKKLVVAEEGDIIAHAQLEFGNGMIMLGSVRDDDFGKLIKPPGDMGGVSSGAAYIVVDDCDAHYEQAKAAGAKMVMDIEEQDYGGKAYTCQDPEGYIWSFGSYDPWAEMGDAGE